MSDNIKVAVRVRPLIQRELIAQSPIFWKVDKNSICQLDESGRTISGADYYFDRVFDDSYNNQDVYDQIVKPIVDDVMQGFNGTIFAYGQTSSGKTFTMTGSKLKPGIIQMAVSHIFETIENTPDREFLLRVSFLEIYNESLSDLLANEKKSLKICEDLKGEVFVTNLIEELVNKHHQIFALMKKGEERRRVGETNMNERSSRSHTIFRIIIESREREEKPKSEDNAINVSHLNLIDLAGSERVSQTGAVGERLREASSINRSLFMLGLVIRKMSEGENQYLNFRDSKLTRILQNSLGGNAKTAIICTITPVAQDETSSTLKFATSAKTIKNKPQKNEVLSDQAMLKRYKREIGQLQSQVSQLKESSQEFEKCKLEDELAANLKLQKEQEEKIARLTQMLCVSSQLTMSEGFPKRKVRRETWCPGLVKSRLKASPARSSDSTFIQHAIFIEEEPLFNEDIDKDLDLLENNAIMNPPDIRLQPSSLETDVFVIDSCTQTDEDISVDEVTQLKEKVAFLETCLENDKELFVQESLIEDNNKMNRTFTLQEHRKKENTLLVKQLMSTCEQLAKDKLDLIDKLKQAEQNNRDSVEKCLQLDTLQHELKRKCEEKEKDLDELRDFTRLEKQIHNETFLNRKSRKKCGRKSHHVQISSLEMLEEADENEDITEDIALRHSHQGEMWPQEQLYENTMDTKGSLMNEVGQALLQEADKVSALNSKIKQLEDDLEWSRQEIHVLREEHQMCSENEKSMNLQIQKLKEQVKNIENLDQSENQILKQQKESGESESWALSNEKMGKVLAEVDILQSDNMKLKTQIHQLQEELDQSRKIIMDLEQNHNADISEEQQEKIQRLESQVNELKTKLNQSTSEVQQLQQLMRECPANKSFTEMTLEKNLQSELKRSCMLQERLDKLSAESSFTRNRQFSDSNREMDQIKKMEKLDHDRRESMLLLAQTRKEQEKEMEALQKHIYELQSQLQLLHSQKEIATHKADKAMREVDDLKTQLRDLESLHSQHMKNQGRKLEKDPDKLIIRIKQLELNLDLTKQKLEKYENQRKQIEETNNKLDSLESVRNELQLQVRDLQHGLKIEKEQCAINIRRKNAIDSENVQLRNQIQQLLDESKASNMLSSNSLASPEVETLKKKAEDLSSHLRDKELIVQNLLKELNVYQHKVLTLEQSLNDVSIKYNLQVNSAINIQEIVSEKEELNKDVKQLKCDKANLKRKLEELEWDYSALKASKEEELEELRSSKETLESYYQELKQAATNKELSLSLDVENLKKELSDRKQGSDELRKQYEQSKLTVNVEKELQDQLCILSKGLDELKIYKEKYLLVNRALECATDKEKILTLELNAMKKHIEECPKEELEKAYKELKQTVDRENTCVIELSTVNKKLNQKILDNEKLEKNSEELKQTSNKEKALLKLEINSLKEKLEEQSHYKDGLQKTSEELNQAGVKEMTLMLELDCQKIELEDQKDILEKTCGELKQCYEKLVILTKELDSLKKELKGQKHELEKTCGELKRSHDKEMTLTIKFDSLKKELEGQKDELDKTCGELKKSHEMEMTLTKKLNSLNKELEGQKDELEKTREELKQYHDKEMTSTLKLDSLKKELESQKDELEKTCGELKRCDEKEISLTIELDSLKKELESRKDELEKTCRELKQYHDKEIASTIELDSLKKELESQKDELEKTCRELKQYHDKEIALTIEFDSLKKELESQKDEVVKTCAELKHSHDKEMTLTVELDSHKKELEDQKDILEKTCGELKQCYEQLMILTKELDSLKKELEKTCGELKLYHEKEISLTVELDSLKKELEEQKIQLEKNSEKLNRGDEKEMAPTMELYSLKNELENQKDELEKICGELKQSQEKETTVTIKLVSVNRELESKKHELEVQKVELERTCGELKRSLDKEITLTVDLDYIKKELENQRYYKDKLQKASKDLVGTDDKEMALTTEINTLKKELEGLKQTYDKEKSLSAEVKETLKQSDREKLLISDLISTKEKLVEQWHYNIELAMKLALGTEELKQAIDREKQLTVELITIKRDVERQVNEKLMCAFEKEVALKTELSLLKEKGNIHNGNTLDTLHEERKQSADDEILKSNWHVMEKQLVELRQGKEELEIMYKELKQVSTNEEKELRSELNHVKTQLDEHVCKEREENIYREHISNGESSMKVELDTLRKHLLVQENVRMKLEEELNELKGNYRIAEENKIFLENAIKDLKESLQKTYNILKSSEEIRENQKISCSIVIGEFEEETFKLLNSLEQNLTIIDDLDSQMSQSSCLETQVKLQRALKVQVAASDQLTSTVFDIKNYSRNEKPSESEAVTSVLQDGEKCVSGLQERIENLDNEKFATLEEISVHHTKLEVSQERDDLDEDSVIEFKINQIQNKEFNNLSDKIWLLEQEKSGISLKLKEALKLSKDVQKKEGILNEKVKILEHSMEKLLKELISKEEILKELIDQKEEIGGLLTSRISQISELESCLHLAYTHIDSLKESKKLLLIELNSKEGEICCLKQTHIGLEEKMEESVKSMEREMFGELSDVIKASSNHLSQLGAKQVLTNCFGTKEHVVQNFQEIVSFSMVKISELEKCLEIKENELSRLKSDVQHLKMECLGQNQELQHLQKELKNSHVQYNEFEVSCKDSQRKLASMELDLSQKSEKLELMRDCCNNAVKEVAKEQEEKESYQVLNKNLQSLVSAMDEDLKHKNCVIEEKEQELEKLMAEIRLLTKDLQLKTIDVNNIIELEKNLKQQLLNEIEITKNLQMKLKIAEESSAKILELEKIIDDEKYKMEIECLRNSETVEELAALTQECKEKSEALIVLQKRLEKADVDYDWAAKRNSELTRFLYQCEDELDTEKKKHDKTISQLKETQNQMKDLEDQLNQSEPKVPWLPSPSISTIVEDLQAKLEFVERSYQRQAIKVNDLTKMIEECDKELDEERQSHSQTKAKLEAVQSYLCQIKSNEFDPALLDKEIDDTRRRLIRSEDINKKYVLNRIKLEAEIQELESKLDSEINAHRSVQKEIDRTSTEIDKLKSELQAEKDTLSRYEVIQKNQLSRIQDLEMQLDESESKFEQEQQQHQQVLAKFQSPKTRSVMSQEADIIPLLEEKLRQKNLRVNSLETQLLKAIDPWKKRVKWLHEELKFKEERITRLKDEIRRLRDEQQDSTVTVAAANQEIIPAVDTSYGSGIIESCNNLTLRSINYQLEKSNKEIKHKYEKLQKEIKTLTVINTDQKNKIAVLQRENDYFKKRPVDKTKAVLPGVVPEPQPSRSRVLKGVNSPTPIQIKSPNIESRFAEDSMTSKFTDFSQGSLEENLNDCKQQ